MPFRQAGLLVAGVVAVSFAAIFIRLADAPTLTVAFYRNAIAAAVLLPLALWRHPGELRMLVGRRLAVAVAAGALLAIHFATWIASLGLTSVAASVVLVTTSPIFVAVGARFLFGERARPAVFWGIGAALAGAAVVSGGGFALSHRAFVGDLLALAGGVAAAGYFLAGQALRRDVSLLTYVGVVYGICAVLLLAAALANGTPLAGFSGKTWLMLVLLAVVPQGIGHTTFNYLLKELSATAVAISVMGEPLGSALLAFAIFGEVPTWATIGGGVLILLGIFIAIRGRGGQATAVVPVD